jgi:hypothetical protein
MRTTRKAGHKQHGELIGEVKVKPRQPARLELGIYEDALPVPRFCLEYEPDMRDDISAALLRCDGQGEYSLRYQLENYGNVTCTVRIWECWDKPG